MDANITSSESLRSLLACWITDRNKNGKFIRRLRSAERIPTEWCFVVTPFPLINASSSKGDLEFFNDLVTLTQPQFVRSCIDNN